MTWTKIYFGIKKQFRFIFGKQNKDKLSLKKETKFHIH